MDPTESSSSSDDTRDRRWEELTTAVSLCPAKKNGKHWARAVIQILDTDADLNLPYALTYRIELDCFSRTSAYEAYGSIYTVAGMLTSDSVVYRSLCKNLFKQKRAKVGANDNSPGFTCLLAELVDTNHKCLKEWTKNVKDLGPPFWEQKLTVYIKKLK